MDDRVHWHLGKKPKGSSSKQRKRPHSSGVSGADVASHAKRFRSQKKGRQDDRGKRNNQRPKSENKFNFQYVETLVNQEDVQQAILDIKDASNDFVKLLDSKDLSADMVVLLVKLISKVCSITFQDIKISLLSLALHSRFMEKLTVYITYIISQNEADKRQNKYFWSHPGDFWSCLLQFSKAIQESIPTNCELIKKLLKNMTIFLPLIEQQHSVQFDEDIKTNTVNLLDIVDKTIQDLEVKRLDAKCITSFAEDIAPPDDFRLIEIIPKAQEIVSESSPFLRCNIVDRPFNDINQYLDIQFRLLREDFMAPLRRGIKAFLSNQSKPKKDWKRVDDVKIYKRAKFLSAEAENEHNCYRIQFDFNQKRRTSNFQNSKRFMFGSLLCFTCDNFRSLLCGQIMKNDALLLAQGVLIVGFHQEVQVNYESEYLMVESSVYFEPYYQVLSVIRQIVTDNFPMERYIIRVEKELWPPQYLRKKEPVTYKVEGLTFNPLDFPIQQFFGLNQSQMNAFKAALTDEFCVIQGPPGTGKTYLGLKIVTTLLQNDKTWYNHTPILVICYTNHALDQFLEGLLLSTHSVLRIGGRSKNEALVEYSLKTLRKREKLQDVMHNTRREICEYRERLKTLHLTLNQIVENQGVITFDCFREFVPNYDSTWFATASDDDIADWLLKGNQRGSLNYGRNYHGEGSSYPCSPTYATTSSSDAPTRQSYSIYAPTTSPSYSPTNRTSRCDTSYSMYNHDIPIYNSDHLDHVHGMGREFEDLEDGEWEDDNIVDVETFRSLTTLQQMRDKLDDLNVTLNKYNSSSTRNNIVREKNKVEAELKYLKCQLEWYDDPRNRKKPFHIDLQNPFNMNYEERWQLYYYWLEQYSMSIRQNYEKLRNQFRNAYSVYNEMQKIRDTQLMKQRRVVGMTTTMAARLQSSLQALRSPIVIVEEAAEILEAHIIASLTKYCKHLILIGDHLQLKPTTADYQMGTKYKLGVSLFERMVNNNIKCHTLNVQHRMRPEISRLIKPHIYPQLEDDKSTSQRKPILGIEKNLYFVDHQKPEESCDDFSKKNMYECKFLIAIARHLILNGYKPEQITILAAYLGQFFVMIREKEKPINIRLLQDVRIAVLDNYQGEESDIILLSLVRSNNENKVGFLKFQNRICVALSRAKDGLYIMGNMSLLLKCDSENQIWGKVNAVLEEQNAIGPYLTLRCQVHLDKLMQVSKAEDFTSFTEGGCDLPCGTQMSCGHMCKRLCHVKDRHHIEVKCYENCKRFLCSDPEHVCMKQCYEICGQCTYEVTRILNCGHSIKLECHINVAEYICQENVLTKLECGHEAQKPCFVNLEEFSCPVPCETRVEPCGHSCDKLCHVSKDPDHIEYKCIRRCARPAVGCENIEDPHTCKKFCFEVCEDCNTVVKKSRSCGHDLAIACKLDVETAKCNKPCKKKLPCGHGLCNKQCSDICGPCEFMVEKNIPDCEHVSKLACHQKPERALCKSRTCPRFLPCGHKCTRPCKDECTKECTQLVDCSNIATPCGHILNKIMCFVKDTNDPKTLLKYCTFPCGIELKCKHKCSGTCGKCMQFRIHQRCTETCGVPLVCNHECPFPCRQACKPCNRPCTIRCGHSKCKKKCGEPCTPCNNDCLRKCLHNKCTRRCGVICNVAPCTKKCRKLLRCGHQCVGFCGDPCPPLCRICNKNQLTEIFFGHEDDKHAIFVLLNDCKHVFEHRGLEQWLNEGGNLIQFKTCPRCKTNIITTERYSEYVKRAVRDVALVKKTSFGAENTELREQLSNELLELQMKCNNISKLVYEKLSHAFDSLLKRLKPQCNDRRQSLNKIELDAIQSKTQIISYIIQCFTKNPARDLKSDDPIIIHLNVLLKNILRSEDHITDQEIEDLEFEIKRLQRIVEFDKIRKSQSFKFGEHIDNIESLTKVIHDELFADKRYTDTTDDDIKLKLKTLAAEMKSTVHISDQERMEIVKAVGLAKGHWFKCPNGHAYAIGECGGANQIAKCPCGEKIGGLQYRLLQGNSLASDMDGATRHAWPGGLH